MKETCFLTNGGNLLCHHPVLNKPYFQRPDGEFIREVSNSEAEFLRQNCLAVECYIKHPEFLPTWNFVKSVRVLGDYSNYKPETSNNGGNYSFHTYHDWFVAKYPDGEWKFAYVERHSTSAEFSYDELNGSFQPFLGCLNISNIIGEPVSYQCKQAKWWDGEEVLEKIANISSFKDLYNEMFEYIPSKWSVEEEGWTRAALDFSDKKEIIRLLKNLGVEKSPKPKSPRGNRGSGKGVRR